jgi:hypothetical protein
MPLTAQPGGEDRRPHTTRNLAPLQDSGVGSGNRARMNSSPGFVCFFRSLRFFRFLFGFFVFLFLA